MTIIKTTDALACTLACALSLCSSAAVLAADANGNRHSWYLGAGMGITELAPDTGNSGYEISDKRDTGFKLFGGYDFSDKLSLEAFYADLGASKVSSPNPSQSDGEISYKNLGASVLWYFWRNGENTGENPRKGWQAYVHGGLSSLSNSASNGVKYEQNKNVQIQYGAALEYGLNHGIALRAGLDLFDVDAGLAYVGVLKRFGSAKSRKPVVVEEPPREPEVKEPVPEPAVPQKVVTPAAIVVSYDTDADGDGVVDRLDQCADSPVDIEVDEKGCTIVPIDVAGVNFAPQSYELTDESKTILDEAAILINASPELQKIEVQAHTDSKGSEKYNLKLSEQRAASVMEYLVSRGVEPSRLISKGYGESQPIADNSTEEGRAKNRRVELKVIQDRPSANQ